MLNFLFKPHRSIFKANTTEAQKVFFLLQLIPQPEIEQISEHPQDITPSQDKSAVSLSTDEVITDLQAEVSVVKGVVLEKVTQVYPSISAINLNGKSCNLGNITTEDRTKFIFELTLSNFKRPPSRVRIAQVRFTSQHEKFPEQNLFVDFTTNEAGIFGDITTLIDAEVMLHVQHHNLYGMVQEALRLSTVDGESAKKTLKIALGITQRLNNSVMMEILNKALEELNNTGFISNNIVKTFSESVRNKKVNIDSLTPTEVVSLFKSGDLAAQKAFITQCPPSPNKEIAETVISKDPLLSVLVLHYLASGYVQSVYLEFGTVISKACYLLAREYFEGDSQKYNSQKYNSQKSIEQQKTKAAEQYLFYAGHGIRNCVLALEQLGKHQESLSCLEEVIPWLEEVCDVDNLAFLRLHRIKIYIHLEEYDLAQSLVEQEKSKYLDAKNSLKNEELKQFDIETLSKLEERLAEIKKTAIHLASDLPTKSEIIQQSRKSMLDDVGTFLQNTPYKEGFQKYESSLREQAQKESENPQEWQLDSIRSYNMLTDFLLGKVNPELSAALESGNQKDFIETYKKVKYGRELQDPNESNLSKHNLNKLEVERQKLNATSIFLEANKANNPVYLNSSLATLTQVRDWAKINNFPDIESDALWGMYRCYNNLEKYPEALETLQELRNYIELLRGRISDPHERAGLMNKFPKLFPYLCQLLFRLNRPTELLQAIEGAKGRVLADVLTQQHTQPVSEKSFAQDVEQLPELMRQVKAHYLTYLVDDEETYAVLVDKHGSTHLHKISIGKNQLKDLLENNLETSAEREKYNPISPNNWGKRKGKIGAKKVPNLSEKLADFVTWLKPLLEAGILGKDDHLCYSQDEYLHLIPLHYLSFCGEPLVKFFSISRIHNASVLTTILNRQIERPNQFTAVYVSAQSDRNHPKYAQEMKSAFEQVAQWLEFSMGCGDIVAQEKADLPTVTKLKFDQRLIHFATHGIFPDIDDQNSQINPYHHSGLIIAKDGNLPINSQGEGGSLLTPEEVLSRKLNFENSHITMQACVSGLAKEGIGGDALGLEWALFLTGAGSLLVTHYKADSEWIAAFSLKFYQKWLFENHSRGDAWRKTMLELMSDPVASHPYNWAAFSLSGDWR